MTYRRLRPDELTQLQTAFIRFLALNGIPADDWEKIKKTDINRMNQLLDTFSDAVTHETLTKVKYLTFKSKRELRAFHCQPDKIVLRGLVISGDTAPDFTQQADMATMIAALQASSGVSLHTYVTEKEYAKTRELELFDMMESGCLIGDGALFDLLRSLGD